MNYKIKAPNKPLTTSLNIIPELIIDRETFDKINYFVDQCQQNECQWFNTLTPLGLTAEKVASYLISDIFIPHQQVNGANVDTTDSEMMQMWKELQTLRNLDLKGLGDLMANPLVWGHSHVNMPTDPSNVDDVKWKSMIETANRLAAKNIFKPTAMLIFNKKGEVFNRLYDPSLGVAWSNVTLYIEENLDYSYIDEALKTKIKELKPVAVTATTSSVTTNLATVKPNSLVVSSPTQFSAPSQTPKDKTKIVWQWGDKKK